jgi:hypothetical protein
MPKLISPNSTCKICNKTLSSLSSLQKHLKTLHKEIDVEEYYIRFLLKSKNQDVFFVVKNVVL